MRIITVFFAALLTGCTGNSDEEPVGASLTFYEDVGRCWTPTAVAAIWTVEPDL